MKTLKVSSRWGKFNLCDSSQESCAVHFEYHDDAKNEFKVLNINIKTDNINDGYCTAEDVAEAIKIWRSGILMSTQEKAVKEFHLLVEDNDDEIYLGNRKTELKSLVVDRDKLNEKIAKLEKSIERDEKAETE